MVLRLTSLGLLCCLLAQPGLGQRNAQSPDLKTIVEQMMAAQTENRVHVRPFVIRRGYLLLDKQAQQKASVVASITVLPPDNRHYQIESSNGGVGEKVLRDILIRETEAPKDARRKELSLDNYDFQLLGQEQMDGRRCYLIALNPRREEKDLLRGKLWVDAETFNIHRVQGSLMKNPSWWIHDVQILMSFAEVDGMWLRTFTQAVANVRFKGKYVMESRDLEYHTIEQTASNSRINPGILAGVAIQP